VVQKAKKKILFVCHGNICRSPMAEGVFATRAAQAGIAVALDSAGVSDWHKGEPPDKRAIAICREHNMDISHQRSRPIEKADFTTFDFILAMDQSNMTLLAQMQPKGATAEVRLFLDYATDLDVREVPDPYYDSQGFAIVLGMIEEATTGLLAKL
jgi:protein-tyrosine phosphatase